MKLNFLIVSFFIFSTVPLRANPGENGVEDLWEGIYSGKERIGYSRTLFKNDNDKSEIVEESVLKVNALGKTQEIDVYSNYQLKGFLLQSFEYSVRAGIVDLKILGMREGDKLTIKMISVSGETDMEFPLDKEPIVSPIIYKWFLSQKPVMGQSYETFLFDPASVITGIGPDSLKASLVLEGRERITIPLGTFDTYRVKLKFMNSESTSWIDDRGEVIRENSQLGLVSIKERSGGFLRDTLSSLDVVEKTAVSSNVRLENPRELKLLRLKISGIESFENLDLIDNNRQFFKDGTIEVRVGSIPEDDGYEKSFLQQGLEEYIEPTSLIQSDDEKIIMLTNEILDGRKDPVSGVRKINDWVYRSLEKSPTIGLPNALDVVKTKKGDCNEHAILFAALTRSVGIPTKVVLGLVFLDDKFYYHAWNEVFLGKWIAVDPTFGQFPADASHVKFIEGNLDKSSEILRLVGKIKLEILEAS